MSSCSPLTTCWTSYFSKIAGNLVLEYSLITSAGLPELSANPARITTSLAPPALWIEANPGFSDTSTTCAKGTYLIGELPGTAKKKLSRLCGFPKSRGNITRIVTSLSPRANLRAIAPSYAFLSCCPTIWFVKPSAAPFALTSIKISCFPKNKLSQGKITEGKSLRSSTTSPDAFFKLINESP